MGLSEIGNIYRPHSATPPIRRKRKSRITLAARSRSRLLHNQPSGDPTPLARADIQMTQAIIDVAGPLGIAVHDNIIVGKDGHASPKALKLM